MEPFSKMLFHPRAGISTLCIVTGLLTLLALLAFCGWLYFSRRSATGFPAGLLVYDDAGRQHLQRPLVSHRLRLRGRPDYLIEMPEGLVPVELKSGNPARVPALDRMPLMWPSLRRIAFWLRIRSLVQFPTVFCTTPMRGGRFRLRRIGNVRFFSWRTRFDATAAHKMSTGNINTLAVVGSAATGLCAKTP